MHFSKKLLAGAAAALAVFAGSAAYAAIPDGNGVIHACYSKTTGEVKVADAGIPNHKTCAKVEAPLDWNQQGPAGAPVPARTVYVHRAWTNGGKAFSGFSQVLDTFSLPVPDVPVPNGGGGPQLIPAYLVSAKLEVSAGTSQFVWCELRQGIQSFDKAAATIIPVGYTGTATLVMTGVITASAPVNIQCSATDAGFGEVVVTALPIDNSVQF